MAEDMASELDELLSSSRIAACFQAQTAWMASKSLVSEVAGVILDIGLHPKGLAPTTKLEAVYTYEPLENDWPK